MMTVILLALVVAFVWLNVLTVLVVRKPKLPTLPPLQTLHDLPGGLRPRHHLRARLEQRLREKAAK